jgi:magnesium transporter
MANEERMESLRHFLNDLIERGTPRDAVALLLTQHPADQADLLEQIDDESRERILEILSSERFADLLEYLDEDLRSRLLSELSTEELAQVLDQVDEDVAVDIVQELSPEQAEEVVPLLEERQAVQELLSYGEETAGGRMSTEGVALGPTWTVEEAIWFLREQHPDTNQPFYLYVADSEGRLQGIVSLRSLITARPETTIATIMSGNVISVEVTDDQELVAERMRHYNLLALPVVDDSNRLRGVITADDILDVQIEEATEDIFRLAGLPDEERLFRPIREATPPRLAWLLINLCTAFVSVLTVNFFEGTIEKVAALAVFMPLVAGMGGNAGIQTITLVVRSLALGELEIGDALRAIKHEVSIALIKGIIIGALVALIAWVWKDSPWLGVVVGLALLANIVNATFIGVLVPLTLKRLRVDPALASGVFVTMLSDAIGLLLLLGLGTLLLSELT